MAVTFNCIDNDFRMNEGVVAFRELFGSYSGEKNIAGCFYQVLTEYKVEMKVAFVMK